MPLYLPPPPPVSQVVRRDPKRKPYSAYSSAILATPGLAAYWRLGESSGTTAIDEIGGHHGLIWNGVVLGASGATLDGNSAFTFDGADDHVSGVTSTSELDMGDVVTIECWVKPGPAGTGGGLVSKGSGAYYLRLDGSHYLNFLRSQVADMVHSTVPVPDGWHHVVATKDGATLKLYIDGVDVTGTATNSTMTDAAQYWAIGAERFGGGITSPFTGSLDEMAIYNRALTPVEVTTHFLAAGHQMLSNWSPTGSAYDATTVGNRFVVGTPSTPGGVGQISAIRYWHTGGEGGSFTHNLRIYDGAGTRVVTLNDTCNGSLPTGWRTVALPTPYVLTPGATYTVAWYGAGWYYAYLQPPVDSASPVLKIVGSGWYAYGLDAFPSGVSTPATYAVDVVYEELVVEQHSGSASLTGGGVITAAATKDASRALVMTGGGVVTRAVTSARSAAVVATGGGVVTRTAVKKASMTAAFTGGGVVTRTGVKGGRQVAAFTGGGVVTRTNTSNRARTHALTGGGVVVPVGRKDTSGSTSGTYSTAVLADSPVAYWRLGEASGATAADQAGAHPGTYVGTPGYGATGAVASNTAITFSGDDYVSVPDHADFDFAPASPFSIEAWFKTTSGAYQCIVGNLELPASNYRGWELHMLSDSEPAKGIRFNLIDSYPGSTISVDTNAGRYNDGAWHHVVVVYNGSGTASGMTFYIDGSVVATSVLYNTGITATASTQPVRIGARIDGSLGFVGQIDEVAIYPTALSAGRVAAHYAPTGALTGGGVVSLSYTKSEAANVTATASLTGGGSLVLAAKKAAARSATFTGGGVVIPQTRKGAVRVQALTGGGVVVPAVVAGRKAQIVATGGGVIVAARIAARSSIAAFTGGGVVVPVAAKGSSSSRAFTGGGVVVPATRKGSLRSQVMTGGGVLVASRAHDRRQAVAATGGGVLVTARTSARSAVVALTGGGTIGYAYAAGSVRSANAALTGGGTISVTSQVARSATVAMTGGGTIAVTANQAQHKTYAAVLTGGGVATVAASSARSRSQAFTGGGVITRTGRKGAVRSQAFTGGGVVVAARAVNRATVVQATGGGIAVVGTRGDHRQVAALAGGGTITYAYAAGTNRSGSASLTGGGSLTVATTSARSRTQVMTGGGVLAADTRKDALRSQLMTGGGVVLVSNHHSRIAAIVLTGGGNVVSVGRHESAWSSVLTGGGVVYATYRIGDAIYIAKLTGGGVIHLTAHAWRSPMTAQSGHGSGIAGTTVVGGLRGTSSVAGLIGSSTSGGLQGTTAGTGLRSE